VGTSNWQCVHYVNLKFSSKEKNHSPVYENLRLERILKGSAVTEYKKFCRSRGFLKNKKKIDKWKVTMNCKLKRS
jgi:hypothetical protein